MNFQDLHNIEGLQFMPVTAKKKPIIKNWQTLATKHNLINCEAVGLVCGKLSGNLEVIDIDEKYSLDGKLFDRYKKLIAEADKELLKKLVVQKTPSGGHHFIYRCSVIEGNEKLAQRPTTEQEKHQTYLDEIKAGTTEEAAIKVAKNDKVRVLLETRGEGGQIVCFPSKGYELVYGDYYSINEITPDERETLINIARQFNSYVVENKPKQPIENRKGIKGLSVFDDYNDRGDVVGLLEKYGWKNLGYKNGKTIFLRPGQTSSASSGNYDHEKKWFSVFTTSTEFEPMKAYLPYAVYAMLECNNNFSEASKKLYEEGYGERKEVEREVNQKVPSIINQIDDDYSFLENTDDFDEYIDLARQGKLPKGLTTGIPSLDEHFLFKRGDMVMINGIDNVGKTFVIIFLQLVAALYHGWKFIIFSSENTNRTLFKRLLEFYWGRKITSLNDIEVKIAKEFLKAHFYFIKSDEILYNYRDIINMVKKAMKKVKFDGGLLDPYNGLKIELTNSSKLNTHEYHYEGISELKQFGTKYDFSWFINNHAVTAALRSKNDDGFQKAPGKEDTEGGGKFSNKAAQFLTIHRLTQHPTEWMVTEIHVRKVKENETGGRVTPKDKPVKIVMNKNGCGFSEYLGTPDDDVREIIYGNDPIANWHASNKPKQQEMELPKTIVATWKPYKDPDFEF